MNSGMRLSYTVCTINATSAAQKGRRRQTSAIERKSSAVDLRGYALERKRFAHDWKSSAPRRDDVAPERNNDAPVPKTPASHRKTCARRRSTPTHFVSGIKRPTQIRYLKITLAAPSLRRHDFMPGVDRCFVQHHIICLSMLNGQSSGPSFALMPCSEPGPPDQ